MEPIPFMKNRCTYKTPVLADTKRQQRAYTVHLLICSLGCACFLEIKTTRLPFEVTVLYCSI